jgi:hypothetical protein
MEILIFTEVNNESEKKKVWTFDLIKLIFSTPQKALTNLNLIKINLISHSRPSPQAFPCFNNLNSPS